MNIVRILFLLKLRDMFFGVCVQVSVFSPKNKFFIPLPAKNLAGLSLCPAPSLKQGLYINRVEQLYVSSSIASFFLTKL